MRFRLHLDFRGASPRTFTWHEYRGLMDAWVGAVAAMPGGGSATRALPLDLTEGSVVAHVRLPSPALEAARRLGRGPNRSWSPEMRRGAEPLWRYLRDKNATLAAGVRRLTPFVVPPTAAPPGPWRERTTVLAEVHMLGGNDARAQFRLDAEGYLVRSDVTKEQLQRLGPYIHKLVYITGTALRDGATGEIEAFEMEDFRPFADTSCGDVVQKLRLLVGDAMHDVDPVGSILAGRR